ncbi:MAG TPA: hypothetical protein VMY34_04045, partial [Acidimicrobiales bacterium]|nr:hypothetical protein [Acidimicrobiales bacterium]
QGFDDGLAPGEVADLISGATTFDDARAELIARTESALVYNESALRSFSEFGVDEVEAIDGDEDAECASRNGSIFSVAEALSITDHPNGTLDWSPVVKAEITPDPMLAVVTAQTEATRYLAHLSQRPITVSSPDVHVAPAVVNLTPSITVEPSTFQVDVHVPEPKPVSKAIERDAKGQITRIVES